MRRNAYFMQLLSACAIALILNGCTRNAAPTITPVQPTATFSTTSTSTSTEAVASTASATQAPTEETTKIISTTAPTLTDTAAPTTQPVTSGTTNPRALAWNPNRQVLAWYATSGQPTNIAEGISARAIVLPCAIAPNIDHGIIYIGGTTAKPIMYALDGSLRVELPQTTGLACALQGRAQYSADGTKLALMIYDAAATTGTFTTGSLRVLQMPEATQLAAFDNVAGFDINKDGIAFVQLFPNSTTKDADSAAVMWWDGTNAKSLEADVRPSQDCIFTAATARQIADNVYTLLGERCTGKGSFWRLIRTNLAGGQTATVTQAQTGGAYFTNTGTHALWALPDGQSVLVGFPNGLNNNALSLVRVILNDGSVKPVFGATTQAALVDQYPPVASRRFLFSPDGQKLAFVAADGNQDEAVFVYNLAQPDQAPIRASAGMRQDRITSLTWRADSQRLYYTSQGNVDGLYSYPLGGESKLVARGVLQSIVINPAGTLAAVVEENRVSSRDVRSNLVLVDLTSGQKQMLVEGAKDEQPLTPLFVR